MLNHHFKVVFNGSAGYLNATIKYCRNKGKYISIKEASNTFTLRPKALIMDLAAIGLFAISTSTFADAVCQDPTNGNNVGSTLGLLNEVACGTSAVASGSSATAIGESSQATATSSVALGSQANASGNYALAIGTGTNAGAESSVAIGNNAMQGGTVGDFDVAIGAVALQNSNSSGRNVGVGYGSGQGSIGADNNYIGLTSGQNSQGNNNMFAGTQSGAQANGNRNTHLGMLAGVQSVGNQNVGSGLFSLAGIRGHNNVGAGVGAGSAVVGSNNVSVGYLAGTQATIDDATGSPTGTTASTYTNAINVGNQTKALTDYSIAIGNQAVAGSTATGTTQAIAIGNGAQALGNQSISIGTGNIVNGDNSGALGDPSTIDGANSYSVGNNNTVDVAITEGAFVLGNSVDADVDNSVYLGNNSQATAGASEGTAVQDSSGATGVTTTAGNTGTVSSATIGNVTYAGFAGATAAGVVTVGAAGTERRIQNVAAGEVSATSTDAINGSQLYHIVQKTSNTANNLPVVYTDENGHEIALDPATGNYYPIDPTTGLPNTTLTAVSPPNVVASMDNPAPGTATNTTNPLILTNVASTLPDTYSMTTAPDGSTVTVTTNQAIPTSAKYNNAATVGDVLNSGWNLQGNGSAVDFVKPYDTVNFKDGIGTFMTISTNGQISNIQYDLKYDKNKLGINDNGELTVLDTSGNASTVSAGKNITVTETTNPDRTKDYKVATKNDVSFDSVTLTNPTDSAQTAVISSNMNGSLDVGGDKVTNVAAAEISANSTDAINGSQLYATNQQVSNNAAGITNNAVGIAGNTKTINKGLNLAGNTGNVNKQLGNTLIIKGNLVNDAPASSDNVRVAIEAGEVVVKIADAPKFKGQLSAKGFDAGEQKVTNVADGDIAEGSTDAVNGSQLHNTNQAINELGYKLEDNEEKANAGTASAMAMASMPQAFLPGKSMLSGGVAAYNGQGAAAVGLSKISDNGRWTFKANGSADTKGNLGVGAGAGFHW